jgi:hypothetical protein
MNIIISQIIKIPLFAYLYALASNMEWTKYVDDDVNEEVVESEIDEINNEEDFDEDDEDNNKTVKCTNSKN